MRIVIDMQGAQTESRFRGIGRYTMEFAQAVVRNRGEHEIVLALSGLFPETIEPIRATFDGLLPQKNILVWHAPGPVKEEDSGNESRREAAELLREAFLASLQPDVIHISSLFEGYVDDAVTSVGLFDNETPVSVILYDLIPLKNTEQYLTPNPAYEQHYRRKIQSLQSAATYLAISEFSRQEAIDVLGFTDGQVVNISTSIDSQFQPQTIFLNTAAKLKQKLGVRASFVLYTGGADERKNLPRLIEAYAALPDHLRHSHQLLFAGKMHEGDTARFRQIASKVGLKESELLFTGYVSDEELVQLYNLCALYVFPSWHEGFGLPALEAMACGAPVIGANTSSLPEVIGLAEALFDPLDVDAITQKIAQALGNDGFRETLRRHGLRQAQRFSWDQTAQRALRTWEALPLGKACPAFNTVQSKGKPRLAFVSPMPPERTGIADYSAELLPVLAEQYTIDVVVTQAYTEAACIPHGVQVRDIAWFRAHAQSYDRVLYQVGNSPFHAHMLTLLEEIPGTVVLHDFYMSGLMAWLELQNIEPSVWTRALYASHGYRAVQARYRDVEDAKRRYPVNWQIPLHARGVIVHSSYSLKLAKRWYGEYDTNGWAVIPHLRSPASNVDRQLTRRQLGIGELDFVICSFGFLDETKQNHRLLNAWLQSELAAVQCCRIIFVGENNGGEYGAGLLRTMRDSGLGDRIRITGFASPDLFRQYLAAADLAVQLRSHSRGETSGTVLDCMNYALPLIVNANGSMAELDAQAVWMLPDDFTDDALVQALESLWRDPERRKAMGGRGQELIHERHAPQECARLYAQAIENAHQRSQTALPTLLNALAVQPSLARSDDAALLNLSQAISVNLPFQRPARRLFLDITAICSHDLKTGIERVARALLTVWLESPPAGFRVEPVYLACANGKWQHRLAARYTLDFLGCASAPLADEPVQPLDGDVVFVLDISGNTLVEATQAGLFAAYRDAGVVVQAVVYDLLPLQLTHVFPPGAEQGHAAWLKAVATFDGALCISRAVADDFLAWRAALDGLHDSRRAYKVGWSHLGADVSSSAPSLGLPGNAAQVLGAMNDRPSFLMVGTIEPRKGYLQVLEAYDRIWHEGVDVNLIIVGREGWKGLPPEMRRDIPETADRLANHPQLNRRLFWIDDASDEYLERIYGASTCLIAASYGEGFGLPLIEAAQHGLPLLVRDLPVFREVAGEHACYFVASSAADLAFAVRGWLRDFEAKKHRASVGLPWCTWAQSAANFAAAAFEGVSVPVGSTLAGPAA